jgi:hypothetical protein
MITFFKMSFMLFFAFLGVLKFSVWQAGHAGDYERWFGFMGIMLFGLLINLFPSLILTKKDIAWLQKNPGSAPSILAVTGLIFLLYIKLIIVNGK